MTIHNRDQYTGRIIKTQSAEERFWTYVQVCEHGRTCIVCCWPWTGKISTRGYGHFALAHRKTIGAHRYAFFLSYGAIDQNMIVCHNCPFGDRPSCCQPAHLWDGTNAENSRDACAKGRMKTGPMSQETKQLISRALKQFKTDHPERTLRGSRNPRAKLTDDQAYQIFQLKDRMGSPTVAKIYNVSKPIVLKIWHKRLWQHIHDTSVPR